jgi:hypothetical protein
MKWTSQPPTVSGFYWVEIDSFDLHHQGPFVLDVLVEDGAISICEAGGDYDRFLEVYEAQEEVHIHQWSDAPIALPDED